MKYIKTLTFMFELFSSNLKGVKYKSSNNYEILSYKDDNIECDITTHVTSDKNDFSYFVIQGSKKTNYYKSYHDVTLIYYLNDKNEWILSKTDSVMKKIVDFNRYLKTCVRDMRQGTYMPYLPKNNNSEQMQFI